MKHKIKLVKGNVDDRFETEPTNKKKMVSLNIGLTQKELTQMKALSGLRGNVANDHELLLTLEEGSIGGFGSHISQFLSDRNLLDNNLKFRSMIFPDKFIDQDKPEEMYKIAGMDSISIVEKILNTLNSKIVLKKTN